MGETVILYTTWPDADTAESVAAEAVAERLAACANLLAPIRSIYRWQGAVDRATETPMLLKTTEEAAERLRMLIVSRHPYDVPCILALAVAEGQSHPEFLQWIASETSGEPDGA